MNTKFYQYLYSNSQKQQFSICKNNKFKATQTFLYLQKYIFVPIKYKTIPLTIYKAKITELHLIGGYFGIVLQNWIQKVQENFFLIFFKIFFKIIILKIIFVTRGGVLFPRIPPDLKGEKSVARRTENIIKIINNILSLSYFFYFELNPINR